MAPIRVKNYKLSVIRPGWKGNLFDDKERFLNEEFPFQPDLLDVLKWKMKRNPQHREKLSDPFRLEVHNDVSFVEQTNDCIVWLGHSTFYIRLNGVVFLVDPVFYDIPFVKRYAPHALSPARVGRIDFLLLSHDHRDHCQERSIREVVQYNPKVEVLTGLQMDGLLKGWIPHASIQCAGWYQQYKTGPAVAVCFMPSRHWGKRGYNDTNIRLWGGFMIQSSRTTLYFSGDTGYGSHFTEAAALFPRIDIAIIGVGAYKPLWFMSPNHISPDDAVRAANELHARMFIPMHYGTFDLSDEPPGEPVAALLAMKKEDKLNGELKILNPGKSFPIPFREDMEEEIGPYPAGDR